MATDQIDEIPLRVARQRGFAEMRVLRQKVTRARIHIREIATPTAGDADLFAGGFCMVDHQNAASAMGRAHHAGCTGAKDDRVMGHGRGDDADRARTQERAAVSFKVRSRAGNLIASCRKHCHRAAIVYLRRRNNSCNTRIL